MEDVVVFKVVLIIVYMNDPVIDFEKIWKPEVD